MITNNLNVRVLSIIKDSFQEWQDHHSLVIFLDYCNLDCFHCHNRPRIGCGTIHNLPDLINKNITPLHDGVVWLGGEPTRYFREIIGTIQALDMPQLKHKVYTNGTLPSVIPLVDSNLIDAWSVDFKCLKEERSILGVGILSYVHRVSRNINHIIQSGQDIEIRTTVTSKNAPQVEAIQDYIKKRWDVPHILQNDILD